MTGQIFGEAEEILLTTDEPHCHLALTTISPGVLVGSPSSSPCHHAVIEERRWPGPEEKALIDFCFPVLYTVP